MNARVPHSTDRIPASALYEEVAERLRSRIFSHELAPGTWIDEQALAEQYGISRTPLREALKVLAAEGLVTLKPRRGCYVTELSERDLDEIFPLLGLLEGRCAFEAAQNARSEDLRSLQALHDQLEQAASTGNIEGFFEANQAFHRAIQEIAGNRWAIQLIGDLRKVLKLMRHQSLFREGRLEQSLAEHRGIVSAVLSRDASGAETAMRAHLDHGRRALARSHARESGTRTRGV